MAREPADAAARRRAIDPTRSFIVKAPAGSGKTRLLVDRYLRLLTRVEHPEEILAITFTIKAAAEMRSRILDAIAADPTIRAIDARRGWDLNNRPDRLKVQTIDSFAFGLARRLPLASGTPFQGVVENGAPLYEEAARRVLQRIFPDDADGQRVADFVALLDNDAARARAFIAEALGKRDQWVAAVSAVARSPARVAASVAAGVTELRRNATASLESAIDPALRAQLTTVGELLAGKRGVEWPGLGDPAAWQLLADALLTANGTLRKRFAKRDGFSDYTARELALVKAVGAPLTAAGLVASLHASRGLPAEGAPAGSQSDLYAIAAALAFAVVDLAATFEARNTMDFSEATVAANRALAEGDAPTELALALDYRIRHILVDEFQDTSLGQHRMLVALTRGWTPDGANTFFAVGDPMQSIYRFRNADLRLFLETARNGLEDVRTESLSLESNFRSAKPLVTWCNAAFRGMFGAETDPIRGAVGFAAAHAENHADGEVRTVVCEAPAHAQGRRQGEVVAARISELQRAGGRIAILARTRAALRDILPVLREQDIQWQGSDVELLADEPVVRDLCSLAIALHDPADRLAWLALCRSPLVGLELVDLERVAGAMQPGEGLPECDGALSADGGARLRRCLTALRAQQRSAPPRARIERVWFALGGPDAYQSPSAMPNAARFFELLDAAPAMVRQPAALRRELDRLFAANAVSDQGEDDGNHPVEVMTIHKAKGLEFDHVIVPGMEQAAPEREQPLLLWRREGDHLLIAPRSHRQPGSLYRWLLQEEREHDRNESKRLFYVAATRATRTLTLVGALASAEELPPRGSFLSLIWPHARDAVDFRHAPEATADPPARAHVLSRLPSGYRFQPAVQLPPVAPRRPPQPAASDGQRTMPSSEAATGGDRQRVLDELARRELKWIAERGRRPADIDLAARARVWGRWLASRALPPPTRAWIEAELGRQIAGVLADADGRWLLFRDPPGLCETSFTVMDGGAPTKAVADRTFVADGERWIVHYKTDAAARGDEAAIAALRQRHAPQLARYARIFQAEGAPPRVALYLTALPRLVELEIAALE